MSLSYVVAYTDLYKSKRTGGRILSEVIGIVVLLVEILKILFVCLLSCPDCVTLFNWNNWRKKKEEKKTEKIRPTFVDYEHKETDQRQQT